MNKKLSQKNIDYARKLYKDGATKRAIGKLISNTAGVSETTIYRYLNDNPKKYRCYDKEFKGLWAELRESKLFLGSIISDEIQKHDLTTGEVADKFDLPLDIINNSYLYFIDEN